MLRHNAEVTWPTHGKDTHVEIQPIFLPAAVTVPQSSRLLALVPTGRKDCYHQARAPAKERAATKILPLVFPPEELGGPGTLEELFLEISRPVCTDKDGDRCNMRPRTVHGAGDSRSLQVSGFFFQADPLTLEYALASQLQIL